ncbi:16S rRNA (guanine(966)-N(2))-methyltransferase RsmD [Cerasibacillus sp. JNUCC 74]|jgi:16S rRNA (guanine966-N2)-methyltransferase|uniref:16S rRNA (guanine(966)-N(2))-methyltransferase RsmD n=1 Tax=Virgibacillus proomii TaxID=84407 RepID=UPI000986F1B8|nr:16S rRNA (guanine(966)-N(2))-methyltransferase RsmD [Virgibacillus proomii]
MVNGGVAMRIIAGEYKGRPIKAVPGKTTRPTTDKVKEAAFQMIGPFFQGGYAIDLFAGSGSLGIEALSRGIDKTIFVDKYPLAIHTIHENLRRLNLEHRAEVFRTDAFRALHAAAKRQLEFQLVLLDPPYGKINLEKLLNKLLELQLVAIDGWIYCEHDASEELPADHPRLSIVKQTNYGGTIWITLYKVN